MKEIERIEQILIQSMAMMDWNVTKSAKAIKQHYLGKLPKEEELPSKDCYCNGEISFCSYCSRILERNKVLADVRKVIDE